MDAKKAVDAAGTPQKRLLYAVFEDAQQAQSAEQALAAEGIQAHRLEGDEAARRLSDVPNDSGLTAKVTRFVKGLGGEDNEAQRYAIHAQEGRVVLVAPAENRQSAERLTGILTGHGAFDVTHFGDWTIEHLSPGENAARGMPTYESSTSADELSTGDEPNPSEGVANIIDKLYP